MGKADVLPPATPEKFDSLQTAPAETKPDSSKRPKWNPKAVPDAPPVANASQVESSPEPTFSESSQASPEAAQTQVRKKWTPKKN